MDKFNQSVDRALAARSAAMQKAATDFTTSITPPPAPVVKATIPPEAPAPAPVSPEVPALVLKDAARWNQVASQYGFKDYNAVAAWQKENGLEADGKFGAASYAKWAQLNPDKVSTVPVIKPRVVTPQTPVTPTEDQTTPLIPEGYVELSRPDGTTFLQRTKSKSTTAGTPAGTPSGATPTAPTAPTTPSTKFSLDAFAAANNLTDFRNFNGKRVVRYDPMGRGDWFIDEEGKTYRADGIGGTLGEYVEATSTKYIPEVQRRFDKLQSMISASYQKQGGTMNRINYFQQGGAAPQQDMQQQVIALVQAAMQGDQKATETVNKIMEAAKAGDQQAMQIAQMIQQVAQKMQGQATAAKWGSKLNYIRSLKFAKGGKACPACEKGAPIVEKKACGGKKAKKRYFGGLV
jgi:peptidoglycan hydrolase-like protein with peptidoglycan-binding domain